MKDTLLGFLILTGLTIWGVHSCTKPNEKIVTEFSTRKSTILKEIETSIDVGNLTQARSEIDKFLKERIRDEDLMALERALKIKELELKVKKIPASKVFENKKIYEELLKLVPDNQRYIQKVQYYSKKVEERNRVQKNREQKFGAAPVASAWDGTYREVKDYLERIAKDPESVKVETCTDVRYSPSMGWLVACNYRARNGFGGMNREGKWFSIVWGRVVAHYPITKFKL